MINGLDDLLTIELNEYGFQIETSWLYIALDWRFLTTALLVTIAYKIYKRKKNK
jgi:hypothetical protein